MKIASVCGCGGGMRTVHNIIIYLLLIPISHTHSVFKPLTYIPEQNIETRKYCQDQSWKEKNFV